MKSNRILDVLIVTHGENGMKRVDGMDLPPIDGVTYVVSWQLDEGVAPVVPDRLSHRKDVEYRIFHDRGSGVNHNHTIEMAKGRYCLVADNDLMYTASRLQSVIETFEEHPDVDLACFKYEGNNNRKYPDVETDLTKKIPKNYSVANIEMAFRRESVYDKVWFKKRFGVGAEFPCVEDALFFHDCRMAGLNCRFFPIFIVSHPGSTTGSRKIADRNIARGEGAALKYVYGLGSAILRVPLFAWRNHRRGRIRFWWGLWYLYRGLFVKVV